MTDTYMHVWKLTLDEYNTILANGGVTKLQKIMFKLFGTSCRYMTRKDKKNKVMRIIIKSIHEKHMRNIKVGTITPRGLWDYVEKKVGERVAFIVDYVETDDYRNFLTTHDEDEVFSVFVNKQEKYGIDAESFRLFGIRKITTMGCTYFSYRLYIIATVTNEELYNRMLKNGIGRKRSYGNGLVSVGADPLEYDDDDILE